MKHKLSNSQIIVTATFVIALASGLCIGFMWGRHDAIHCAKGTISYYDKTGKNILFKDCSP